MFFFFFSNRLGCLGSLLISTLVALLLIMRLLRSAFATRKCIEALNIFR
jgi:hypothetical protein